MLVAEMFNQFLRFLKNDISELGENCSKFLISIEYQKDFFGNFLFWLDIVDNDQNLIKLWGQNLNFGIGSFSA
jgi:hypothetical protein